MPSLTEWRVPPAYQPRSGEYSFDLDRALSSVVGLHSIIPADAFTAETLGTERAGNGVVIDDGLVLTIGYLITEAESVWLHLGDGRVVEGHALGFDPVTGFGLVQALGRIDLDPLPIGSSAAAKVGDHVIDAYGYVFANLLVMIVRQRLFEGLQTLHRLTQCGRFLVSSTQKAEAEERLNAVELIVVGLIRTNLRVKVLEVARNPGRIA